MIWRTGKEIDESIDRTIFQMQAKDYVWERRLSIRPRRCYWTGDIIWPFSYAMVAVHPKDRFIKDVHGFIIADLQAAYGIHKWVSMPNYIFLQLKGKL